MYVENYVNSGEVFIDNPEPSLPRNRFEGATTRIHQPERLMKSLHSSEWKRIASLVDDDIV
ncbi:hypothetical protein VP277E431_P0265 [Vibrio phage 277E43-1]|nr:hypothetical protein VP277E431_P0265 [Vibrio phage 277E43-1]